MLGFHDKHSWQKQHVTPTFHICTGLQQFALRKSIARGTHGPGKLLSGEYLARSTESRKGTCAGVDACVREDYSEAAVAYATGAVCRAAKRP